MHSEFNCSMHVSTVGPIMQSRHIAGHSLLETSCSRNDSMPKRIIILKLCTAELLCGNGDVFASRFSAARLPLSNAFCYHVVPYLLRVSG